MAKNELDPMVVCIRMGIKIYADYQHKDRYVKGVLAYEKDNWYVEVDNNGEITRYRKSIAKGKILKGKDALEPLQKTAKHWAEKINAVINNS